MEANNMAAMREALTEIQDKVFEIMGMSLCDDFRIANLRQIACAALAKPPRNCDVGTAVEQMERMDAFCSRCGKDADGAYRCENCNLLRMDRCELVWAQMPYESEAELAPRPATENEIDAGKAKWCEACATDCPDKGKDLLCICGRFKKESEAKG